MAERLGLRPPETNHGPRPPYPSHSTILDMLRQHVADTPDALALVLTEGEHVDGTRREVTYGEMWEHVAQIARALRNAGACSGSRWVMIVLPEGLQQVCAVWGVMAAGCGYVPIDVETEPSRLRTLAAETQPSAVIGEVGKTPLATVAAELGLPIGTFPSSVADGMVVTQTDSATAQRRDESEDLPKLALDDYALLLYSSGSTGVPKGIVYDHRWLAGGSWFLAQDLGLNPSSRCLLRCSYVWSVSLYDLFPVNMMGGCLYIPPPGGHKNVQYMSETIEREAIHAVVMQPTLLTLLLDEHKNSESYPLRSLRHVVSSGEKLFTSTAELFLAAPGLHAKLWNMYGATEAGCTYFVCAKGDEARLRDYPEGVPAGVPQSYVDVYIMRLVDDNAAGLADPLVPVATGQIGEICFGGAGPAGFLARGYWRRPELTSKVFLNTKSYGRIYRTGDAGQWRSGEVVVCGRLDRQVKVHGVRIQPESIEAVLKRFKDSKGELPIKACLVVPTQHEPTELVAFVESGISSEHSIDISAVMAFLRQELGRLYVPKHVVHLADGLPRTASGKPDQNVLKKLASVQDREDVGAVAPDSKPAVDDGDGSGSESTSDLSTVLGHLQRSVSTTGSSTAEHTLLWEVDLRLPVWQPLQDHRYRGEALFPGSGYVALGAEVCCAEGWGDSWELRDIVFRKPLPLENGQLPRIRVKAVPVADNSVEIEISSLQRFGEWMVHATCTGKRLDPSVVADAGVPSTAPAVAPQNYPVKQLYAQLADGGFDYGHQFQSLTSVSLHSPHLASATIAHRGSPFLMDFVTVDACFHMAPLVSPITGFEGAPVRINRVQCFGRCPESPGELRVVAATDADASASGRSRIDFRVGGSLSTSDVTLFKVEGLELQSFESMSPRLLHVRSNEYLPSKTKAAVPPRVIALGASSSAHAEALAHQLKTEEATCWVGEDVETIPLRSVALVVSCGEEEMAGLEGLLLALQQELPWQGRVWLVVVGDGNQEWQSRGREWSVKFPALLLSVLSVRTIDRSSSIAALLDPKAPPCINNERTWSLEDLGWQSKGGPHAMTVGRLCGKLLAPGTPVLVLASERNALVNAMLHEAKRVGSVPRLLMPGASPSTTELSETLVILCAVGPGDYQEFESICANCRSCVTLASMDAILPSAQSARVSGVAQAVARSWWRAQALPTAQESGSSIEVIGSQVKHESWVVFVPPLFDGLWWEPPAPAGFHRCSVDALTNALAEMVETVDTIVGPPKGTSSLPKNYSSLVAAVHSRSVVRTEDDVVQFLLEELRDHLPTSDSGSSGVTTLSTDVGLDDLGVTSLLSLRLSQRLRRFLGSGNADDQTSFSAFLLSRNPTIAQLAAALAGRDNSQHTVDSRPRRLVLCLHGYRTSGTVLQQQMVPLNTTVFERLGYEVLAPNGPYKTSGAAQFAAGLDEDDSYGWWTYADEQDATNDQPPVGLSQAAEYIDKYLETYRRNAQHSSEGVGLSMPTVDGIVGFSQGGAMAAQLANHVGARWALLFSPVYAPTFPAQCDCPTLVAFDRADEVFGATETLLEELSSGGKRREALVHLEHQEGHRLPADEGWYAPIAEFLDTVAQ